MSPSIAVADDRGRSAYKMLYDINVVVKISDQMAKRREIRSS